MMKDWITIGQLAKKTGLTARAIRFYEAKGLLKSHSRGDNDYRFYAKAQVDQAHQIKNFRDLGFALSEIAELLAQDPALTTKNLQSSLVKKLKALKTEHTHAEERIHKLEVLIASLNNAHKLSEPQRRIIMEELVVQAKQQLKARGVQICSDVENTLRVEVLAAENPKIKMMMGLLDTIKNLSDEMKIPIGPGRGTVAASLLLYSKGFNHNYSQNFDLLPDLFFRANKPLIWVDVDYDIAPEFLNRLLKRTTLEALREANIFIFQCPFLTVLSKVEKQVGPIDFDAIPDHDERVLKSFVAGQVQNIFLFDAPEKSVMHANSQLDFWQKENELKKAIWKHLETYKVKDVEDILNINTLSFPVGNKTSMLEQYIQHDKWVPEAKNLPTEVRKVLTKTKGLLIYREDFIRILQVYLDWTVTEGNQYYQFKLGRTKEFPRIDEYEKHVPLEVRELLDREISSVFLKSHMVCMWWFVKRSAVMNSLYPTEYLAALKDWQDNHHSAWSDLGFIDKDFRPLALYF
ncbi:MerR family transcriptional regulator [Bdellovibrio sp. HCB337]|uniref:MerR family transcriptional regulator n=1 Tax=Bdellovibrio sp. HCB337 TaxID=3394358 RepID=UPI0039A5D64B